jgi:(2Fe-2S) ferredoxin
MESKFKRHFFVCVMQRPAGAKPSCGARGGIDVYNRLMEGIGGNQPLWDSVSVTTTGCLGPCFDGPMAVCYPEGTWYKGLEAGHAAEIVEQHMVGGEPVERLRYTFPTLDD